MKRKLPPLNAVVAFESAARRLSFKNAGAELCVTASAISHQVRALEQWLGVKLFERSTRTITLTDFGMRYQQKVNEVLNELEKISNNETRTTKNKKIVTIQTTDSFAARCLIPRLPKFESQHPDITIKIITRDFRASLRESESDLGILFLTAQQKTDDATLLSSEEIFPVCNPKILPADGDINLSQFPLIHDDNIGITWRDWLEESASQSAELDTAAGARYNHSHLALQAAELGAGFTLASNTLAADALKRGDLTAPFAAKITTGCGYYLLQSNNPTTQTQCKIFANWLLSQR